jgi:hypothetical protein
LVVTPAADFLHNPGDGAVDPSWMYVIVCATGWAWRWWSIRTNGKVGLARKADNRVDPVARVELSGQRKCERANS